MSLPSAAEIGLKMYGIDSETLALRGQVWTILEPHIAEISRSYMAMSIEHAPYYHETLRKNAPRIQAVIEAHTKALFTEPFDKKWIVSAKERVREEIELGYDMRNRGVINRAVLSSLSLTLGRRWGANKAHAMKLMDVATRILMLDVANAVALHHHDVQRGTAHAHRDELDAAIQEFQSSVDDVRRTLDRGVIALKETATRLIGFAEQASAQCDGAAKAATSAVSHVAHIASATEELNVSIEEIRQRAVNGAGMAHDAVTGADHAGATIHSLSDLVSEIGSIVELISGIAGQTNLLALNAAIELARAGEAGKGFAVVASEVKSLAGQTSKATQDIARQIAVVEETTRQSVEAIGVACKTIASFVTTAEAVSFSVAQQASATASIAVSAADASSNAGRVSEALNTVGNTIHQTQSAAASVLGFSQELSGRTAGINSAIDRLLKVAADSVETKRLVSLVAPQAWRDTAH